jgi:hypothetical protein
VEKSFPWRGKTAGKFSIAWKIRTNFFHGVENPGFFFHGVEELFP